MVAPIANSQEVINRKKKQESKQRKGSNSNQNAPSTLSRRNPKENDGKKIDFRGKIMANAFLRCLPIAMLRLITDEAEKNSLMTINPTGEK